MGHRLPFLFEALVAAKSMTQLKTKRLTLRPLRKEDGPLVAQYAGDWDVARMTERIPFPYEADVANGWVESLKDDIVFAIDFDGGFVGCCGIAKKPDSGETELGYWIARPWWGRGIATEAARAVAKYAFVDLGTAELVSGHFEDNPASSRVLMKIGFLPTGERCERYCEARSEKVICVGFHLTRERATELGLVT